MTMLRGQVVSGVGNFAYRIERLREHYRRKTGLWLHPCTLNIELVESYVLPRRRTRLEASDYGGTVSVNIVACTILGQPGVILRTDKADSEPESQRIIEVACEVGLRATFGLQDGDTVEVEVMESA